MSELIKQENTDYLAILASYVDCVNHYGVKPLNAHSERMWNCLVELSKEILDKSNQSQNPSKDIETISKNEFEKRLDNLSQKVREILEPVIADRQLKLSWSEYHLCNEILKLVLNAIKEIDPSSSVVVEAPSSSASESNTKQVLDRLKRDILNKYEELDYNSHNTATEFGLEKMHKAVIALIDKELLK